MFRWIFRTPRFRCYEDSFARDRNGLLAGLRQAIENRQTTDQVLIVVAHFADEFTAVQQAFESWGTAYDIVTRTIDGAWLDALDPVDQGHRLFLCLSAMMSPEHLDGLSLNDSIHFGVLVVERHPLPARDRQVEEFCRALPGAVELGYFLSFDQSVLRRTVDDAFIKILKMFGMGENELITSNMVSRRIKMVLQHNARKYGTDHPADSADEWFERNNPSRTG